MRRRSFLTMIAGAAPSLMLLEEVMTVTPASATLSVGETVQLLASGPVQNWTSSNPAVATVSSSGLVTAITGGNVTITAKWKSQRGTSNVTVDAAPPPPPPSGRGPQPGISAPLGAKFIAAGSSIQAAIDANPTGTAFSLGSGVHQITVPIIPKSGQTFVGQYGAILDGTGLVSTDGSHGAFKAHNQDIDFVTIRNLVIRNFPQKGIHTFKDFSNGWLCEYLDIHHCKQGVHFSNDMIVQHSLIHECTGDEANSNPSLRGGAYLSYGCNGAVLQFNDITFNGKEQKFFSSNNSAIRGNFFKGGACGAWMDGCGTGNVIEDNTVEDTAGDGISVEACAQTVVSNNSLLRANMLISVSYNIDIFGNQMVDCFRSQNAFLDCVRLAESNPAGPLSMHDINFHDNDVTVSPLSGHLGASLYFLSTCTTAQADQFAAANIKWVRNVYRVPVLANKYWMYKGINKTWAEWQALGQDAGGTVLLR